MKVAITTSAEKGLEIQQGPVYINPSASTPVETKVDQGWFSIVVNNRTVVHTKYKDVTVNNVQMTDANAKDLANEITKSKGGGAADSNIPYFSTEEKLLESLPSPKPGQTAWVGSPYPGTVYDVVDDTWNNTGEIPPVPSVDLDGYAKEEDLLHLGEEVSQIDEAVFVHIEEKVYDEISRESSSYLYGYGQVGSTVSSRYVSKYEIEKANIPYKATGLTAGGNATAHGVACYNRNNEYISRFFLTTDINNAKPIPDESFIPPEGTVYIKVAGNTTYPTSLKMLAYDGKTFYTKEEIEGRVDIGDLTNKTSIDIARPLNCARVDISIGVLPNSKSEGVKLCTFVYSDENGNYFQKYGEIKVQGSTSVVYPKKNFTIDIFNDEEHDDGCVIKFGDWLGFDSYHWKAFYIDAFRGQCVVAYRLFEEMYQTRDVGQRKPYDFYKNADAYGSGSNLLENFESGALCHPDGFPFMMYVNGEFYGLYSWCIKKTRSNFNMKKSNAKQIIMDSAGVNAVWDGTLDWTGFELRNPGNLIDIDGNPYDGDNPKELSDTDPLSVEVKGYIQRLSGSIPAIKAAPSGDKRTKSEDFINLEI